MAADERLVSPEEVSAQSRARPPSEERKLAQGDAREEKKEEKRTGRQGERRERGERQRGARCRGSGAQEARKSLAARFEDELLKMEFSLFYS